MRRGSHAVKAAIAANGTRTGRSTGGLPDTARPSLYRMSPSGVTRHRAPVLFCSTPHGSPVRERRASYLLSDCSGVGITAVVWSCNRHYYGRLAVISVVLYTKNEEVNIRACLATVQWSDDIHVVDSHSTDDTAVIARALGAQVVSRSYVDESEHKNWAMQNLPFRHDWVFQIDADERCTPELVHAMLEAARDPGPCVAFRFPRRDFLFGRWIRHVQLQRHSLRLMRPDAVRYERRVHPVCHVRGPIGRLDGYLDHFPFNKGMAHWIARHNRYSTLEAEEVLSRAKSAVGADLYRSITERDCQARRYYQKRVFYRLPLRPLLKFGFLYIARRGFLDGRAGLHYALLQSWYEYMIALKTAELRARLARNAAQGRAAGYIAAGVEKAGSRDSTV